jgi:hypothetical protein
MNKPTFMPLDYIANEMYQADARIKGFCTGVRWWCIREDLREAYLNRARQIVQGWADEEATIYDEQSGGGNPSNEGGKT